MLPSLDEKLNDPLGAAPIYCQNLLHSMAHKVVAHKEVAPSMELVPMTRMALLDAEITTWEVTLIASNVMTG